VNERQGTAIVFTIQEFNRGGIQVDEFPDLESGAAVETVAEIRSRGNVPAVKNTPGLIARMAVNILKAN
jgi:hypothetical protein